jgi:Fic family protein
MQNLVDFINDDTLSDLDPLVKMAMIHHQFESIHPFYDGNGRTGRIINILYLVIQDLLSLPILYLSGFVVRHKQDYYRLLQQVRDTGNWEDWILFNLKGVEQTAQQSIALVTQMNGLMLRYKHQIRLKLPTLYSQDLINHLFRHPYTKVDFLTTELQVSKSTAIRYLTALVEHDFLEKYTIGKNTFYINKPLFELFKK